MRRKKIYCKIHNKRTEAQFAKQKQHRSLTIWTPDKMLRLPRRPWTARKRGENQPQPIKESGNLRRKDKPKSAGRNSVKGTLDTYAK